jgi:hypothetical protein
MQELLKLAKQSLSIIETSKAKDGEIQMYIDAGINDLTRQGIEVMNKLNNSLVQNAIIMYVKANFGNVDIKEKERDAIILIFGDALWENPKLGPKCLKYEISDVDYLDDICVLTYFKTMNSTYVGCINLLKDIVGIKHIITTKETTLYVDKK